MGVEVGIVSLCASIMKLLMNVMGPYQISNDITHDPLFLSTEESYLHIQLLYNMILYVMIHTEICHGFDTNMKMT